eukprot:2727056-Rhodomonas_salina.1
MKRRVQRLNESSDRDHPVRGSRYSHWQARSRAPAWKGSQTTSNIVMSHRSAWLALPGGRASGIRVRLGSWLRLRLARAAVNQPERSSHSTFGCSYPGTRKSRHPELRWKAYGQLQPRPQIFKSLNPRPLPGRVRVFSSCARLEPLPSLIRLGTRRADSEARVPGTTLLWVPGYPGTGTGYPGTAAEEFQREYRRTGPRTS